MDIKFLKIGLLITATQFLFAFGCTKNDTKPCHNYTPYSFLISADLIAPNEVYQINDTLIFTSTFPKNLQDHQTNSIIDYSNASGISANLNFGLIDSDNHEVKPAVDSFNFVSIYGSIAPSSITSNQSTVIYYQEKNTTYNLTIKIIPKRKGNYQIVLTDGGSIGIKNKNCTNADFINKIINPNKNLHILTNAKIPGVILDQYLTDRIYCFRVQ
jgi:hypothetical protein